MSHTLEIVNFERNIPYRSFIDHGMNVVYPHWHKEIEIIHCKKGSINIGIEDEMIQLHEGEIVYFASGEEHYFLASTNSVRNVFMFDLKLLNELDLRENQSSVMELLDNGQRHSRYWPDSLVKSVAGILDEMFDAFEQADSGSNYTIYGNLHRLVGSLYQKLPQKEGIDKTLKTHNALQFKELLERMNSVLEYVEAHYGEAIKIKDVADQIGFSEWYFTKVFKKMTGETFMTFLEEYRIRQAKFILAHEKIPMIEVAEKSGFQSVKTFHHVFKKAVGQSPLQYQKKLLETTSN